MEPITINISKALLKKSDFVAISRKDYEEFLSLKKIVPIFIYTFMLLMKRLTILPFREPGQMEHRIQMLQAMLVLAIHTPFQH